MYYVEFELQLPDGSMNHTGTSSSNDLDKVISEFKAFREVGELLVCSAFAVSYDLRLGTTPSFLQ